MSVSAIEVNIGVALDICDDVHIPKSTIMNPVRECAKDLPLCVRIIISIDDEGISHPPTIRGLLKLQLSQRRGELHQLGIHHSVVTTLNKS